MALLHAGAPQSAKKRPNVVIVLSDELRYSALGCMGNSYIKTPNFDKFADQGVRFTNAFSSTPICSPYRAQLMTGKYGTRNGVIHNSQKLPNRQKCMAEIFKKAGYKTGFIGKWHLEGNNSYVPPGRARQGWEHWASFFLLPKYLEGAYYFLDDKQPIFVDRYEVDVQTDMAIEYMREHKSEPFCLLLSWNPPHPPFTPPEKYDIYDPDEIPLRPNVPERAEKAARRDIANYYGLVTSIDTSFGLITKALDELGIAENTIICVTSDHGSMLSSQGHKNKALPWEEAIHIPFIARYPGKIQPGRKIDSFLNSVDVLPTLLGLCDLPIPDDVQGEDLSPVVLGEADDGPRQACFSISRNPPWVRFDWRGIRTEEWKYAATAYGDWLLYNIKEDPYELKNLASSNEHREKKFELKNALKEWLGSIGDDFEIGDGVLTDAKWLRYLGDVSEEMGK